MCEHFTRELAKIVVAQIVNSAGFESIQVSALETLTDIMIKYIEEVGYNGNQFAELSCRTECNFNDLRLTFHDLNVSMADLLDYLKFNEEVPFARPIPQFPVKATTAPIIEKKDGNELPSHVPSFLPPFPEKHTYIFTPNQDDPSTDPSLIRKNKNKHKRQALTSLTKLSNSMQNNNEILERSVFPEYYTTTSNAYVSTAVPPPKTPVTPSAKHLKYINEANPDQEGERTQKICPDIEEEGERTKKINKYKKILESSMNGDKKKESPDN